MDYGGNHGRGKRYNKYQHPPPHHQRPHGGNVMPANGFHGREGNPWGHPGPGPRPPPGPGPGPYVNGGHLAPPGFELHGHAPDGRPIFQPAPSFGVPGGLLPQIPPPRPPPDFAGPYPPQVRPPQHQMPVMEFYSMQMDDSAIGQTQVWDDSAVGQRQDPAWNDQSQWNQQLFVQNVPLSSELEPPPLPPEAPPDAPPETPPDAPPGAPPERPTEAVDNPPGASPVYAVAQSTPPSAGPTQASAQTTVNVQPPEQSPPAPLGTAPSSSLQGATQAQAAPEESLKGGVPGWKTSGVPQGGEPSDTTSTQVDAPASGPPSIAIGALSEAQERSPARQTNTFKLGERTPAKPTSQSVSPAVTTTSPPPKAQPQAFSMVIKGNQPILKKNALNQKLPAPSPVKAKPQQASVEAPGGPSSVVTAGLKETETADVTKGEKSLPPAVAAPSVAPVVLPSFSIRNTAPKPKRDPKPSSRTTTRWGKDLPTAPSVLSSPPAVPPAVDLNSPGDPSSPPKTQAVPSNPTPAEPGVLEEPLLPPPVKGNSPAGPSSPTDAPWHSRESKSPARLSEPSSPADRRRDSHSKYHSRHDSRTRDRHRSRRRSSSSGSSPYRSRSRRTPSRYYRQHSRSRSPYEDWDRGARDQQYRRYPSSPRRGYHLYEPGRMRHRYDGPDFDRSHRDRSRYSPRYGRRDGNRYWDRDQRYRNDQDRRRRSRSARRGNRSPSRGRGRDDYNRSRSLSSNLASEEGEVAGSPAQKPARDVSREKYRRDDEESLEAHYARIRDERKQKQEQAALRSSQYVGRFSHAAKDAARKDTSGARPGPSAPDLPAKATSTNQQQTARAAKLKGISALQEKIKSKVEAVFKYHDLGEPARDLSERLKQVKQLVGQTFNEDNRNVILTFDGGLDREYKTMPVDDLTVLGDPAPFGTHTWDPNPLTLLDDIPELPTKRNLVPREREEYIMWSPGISADPRIAADSNAGYLEVFVEPHKMAIPDFALLKEAERPVASTSHTWAGGESDQEDDALSAVPPPPMDPSGMAPPPPPIDNHSWAGAPLPPQPPSIPPPLPPESGAHVIPTQQYAARPPWGPAPPPGPHPQWGAAPPPGNPSLPALAPPKPQRLEPEQTCDWQYLGPEGRLSAPQYFRLETLRSASREKQADKGPCAYRKADNLWLPVNQVRFTLQDLAWKGADSGPRSSDAPVGGAPGDQAAQKPPRAEPLSNDQPLKEMAMPERCTKPVTNAHRSELNDAEKLQALVSKIMSRGCTKGSLAELEQRARKCQENLRNTNRHRPAEQPSKKQKLEEGAKSEVWGPKPPAHVLAMLKGSLALRLLSGKEGETLVARVVEDAFDKLMTSEKGKEARMKLDQEKQLQKEREQKQLQRQLEQMQEARQKDELDRKQKAVAREQAAQQRREEGRSHRRERSRSRHERRTEEGRSHRERSRSRHERHRRPSSEPRRSQQRRSPSPARVAAERAPEKVSKEDVKQHKSKQGSPLKAALAEPTERTSDIEPERQKTKSAAAPAPEKQRHKRKIVASDSDDDRDYDPGEASQPKKPNKRSRGPSRGPSGRQSRANSGSEDQEPAISDVSEQGELKPSDEEEEADNQLGDERLRANMYKTQLPEMVKKLLLAMKRLDREKCSEFFKDPVSIKECPDYLDEIQHPMDLSTLSKKWAKGDSFKVHTLEEVEQWKSDLLLIVQNARKYSQKHGHTYVAEAADIFDAEFGQMFEAALNAVKMDVESTVLSQSRRR